MRPRGAFRSPGYFEVPFRGRREPTLVASTESWEIIFALTPEEASTAERERRRLLLASATPAARTGFAGELVFAADQFIISPAGRVQDEIRARASGFEMKTVIAGYHWFTDWGRDTMISLEGLSLVTGRLNDAASILRAFGYYLHDGLIPNMFPEGETGGALQYGRRHALVLSRHRPVPVVDGGQGHLEAPPAETYGYRRTPPPRYPLQYRGRSQRRPPPSGRGGLSAHLDGCEGGRLGGYPPPGQGGRNKRPVVQRAAAPSLVDRGRGTK